MQPFALIIAIVLFFLGIIGSILPVMPGAILIWAGMLIYGVLTGFTGLSFVFYLLQGLAVLLVMFIDYLAAALGTKSLGGSKTAMWGAVFGLFLGILVLGPAGIIFGPFLGALAGELLKGLPADKALRSSFGALIGLLGSIFLKLIIEAVMILWFFKNITG